MLGKHRVHLSRSFPLHVGQYMRIGVQGDRNASVAQKFLHYLGMDAPAKHERRAGVTEVVETDLGKARAIEERLEGSNDEVTTIDGGANLRGKDEPVFLPESGEALILLALKLTMSLQSFYSLLRQLYATLASCGFRASEDGVAVL
jgi:hypothetical protein